MGREFARVFDPGWPMNCGVTGMRACAVGIGLLCGALLGCGRPATPPGDRPAPAANVPATPAKADPSPDAAAIQATLEEAVRGMRGKVHAHVRVEVPAAVDPRGFIEAGVNADAPVPAASVIKLPLAAAAEEAWHAGKVERSAEDLERVRKMITHSDNPAADAMMERLGLEQVNAWLDEHGYVHTRIRHRMLGKDRTGANEVSARDMTEMLLAIARGRLVNAEASRELREFLLTQTRRARIPAGLPKDAVVGNKTGTLRGLVHDVAYVVPPEGPTYALAVLISQAGPEARANRAIARISKVVYAAVTAGSK